MLKKVISISFVIFSLLISGCIPKKVTVDEPMNVVAVKNQLEQTGNNTIEGTALIRQRGGNVVHCGGNDVKLMPVTPWSKEMVRKAYGDVNGGYLSKNLQVTNAEQAKKKTKAKIKKHDIEKSDLRLVSTCDAQGNFKFTDLKDGSYYAEANVRWMVDQYTQAGGTLMEKVEVSGGETKDITMSP